ncbi:MAG TPA: hypothetical protein VL307_10545 [Chitinophagaceae bacterium]|nr:hypothetical protein [Chitinophagaceae bacterium]
MHIQFKKNIQFTRLIKADGHLREFNFRKLTGFQDELFTVDVSDDRGNRIMFRMRKEDGTWKIVAQPLPEWVSKNEATFHDVIEEELRQA